MIFYFLYYFSSFHFIFIHSPFHFFFPFSFSWFSPPHKCLAPLLLFSFSPQKHSNNSFASHQRERGREGEREREGCLSADGDRGRRKDKSVEIGIHHAALRRPLPHHLGQIGILFFFSFFFFSYLLVLIQLYFKNWILFCVLCLENVRNGVRLACSFFFHICLFWFNFILRIRFFLCFVFGLCEKRREWERKKEIQRRRKNWYNSR